MWRRPPALPPRKAAPIAGKFSIVPVLLLCTPQELGAQIKGNTAMATALLVYEQHIIRNSLRHYLESNAELTVIGDACEGKRAVDIAQRFHPDLVIMDAWLGGLSAHSVARRIFESCPRSRLLIVSTRGPHNSIQNWMRAGIAGYLLEESTPEELVRAIEVILGGESYLSPSIAKRVLDAAVQSRAANGVAYSMLTVRELEVLQLVAGGLSTKEAAKESAPAPADIEA